MVSEGFEAYKFCTVASRVSCWFESRNPHSTFFCFLVFLRNIYPVSLGEKKNSGEFFLVLLKAKLWYKNSLVSPFRCFAV